MLSNSLSSVHPLLLLAQGCCLGLGVKPLWLWSQGCCLGLGCQTDVVVVLGPDVGHRTMWQLGICFIVVVRGLGQVDRFSSSEVQYQKKAEGEGGTKTESKRSGR